MSISKEAIEAGARAICLMEYGVEWEHMGETGRESCRREASVTLTAAAPAIQAAALRYAADDSRMGPVPYGWNASGVASWLRDRADQLEGKSE